MSQKITGKNLSYNRELPPFLAALRGEIAQREGPDPILASHRRAAKPRSGSAEAEDAPLMLDEEGNVLAGFKIGVDGVVIEEPEAAPITEPDTASAGDAGKEEITQQKDSAKEATGLAGIGATKKRKAGKVVGGDDDDADNAALAGERPEQQERRRKTVGIAGARDKIGAKASSTTGSSSKKKAKKIKLSFGDGDGD